MATTGSEFREVVKTLESCGATTVFQWISEALGLIYTAKGPPKSNVTDDCKFISENYEPVKTLGASDGACTVTAVITQWILRFMCKKLMQLMDTRGCHTETKVTMCMCNYF